MARAFSTGAADPLDWIFLCKVLAAQSAMGLSDLFDVASAVSPCTVNVVIGEVFGGYTVVVCEYPSGPAGPAFNYVSILGTHATGELWLDIIGAPLAPAPWLGEPFRGDVVAFFAANSYILSTAVRSVLKNEAPTIFAGHSLGGASCQIMASQLNSLGYPVMGCYTIGSPKPGSQAFAASLPFPVLNLEAFGDPVPSLPVVLGAIPGGGPWWLKLPTKAASGLNIWAQTGTLLTLNWDGTVTPDGGQQYDIFTLPQILIDFEFTHHHIAWYSGTLTKYYPMTNVYKACGLGYEKPWRIFGLDDPEFPPHPPAPLAPCVNPNWNNNVFVYLVDYLGNAKLLATIPDPPPTFPTPPISGRAAPARCCKSRKS